MQVHIYMYIYVQYSPTRARRTNAHTSRVEAEAVRKARRPHPAQTQHEKAAHHNLMHILHYNPHYRAVFGEI